MFVLCLMLINSLSLSKLLFLLVNCSQSNKIINQVVNQMKILILTVKYLTTTGEFHFENI